MKKVLAIVAAMMFIMVGSAMAAPITIKNTVSFAHYINDCSASGPGTSDTKASIKYDGNSVRRIEKDGDFVEWSYSFVFDPPKDPTTVATAKLTLHLRDDDDIWEEYAEGGFNGKTWSMGEVNTGDYIFYNLALVDNKLTIKIVGDDRWWNMGNSDFYLDGADLEVTYTPAPVPEPATMTLLGIGMVGAGIAAKRRNRKNKSEE